MGYTTDFTGSFKASRLFTKEERDLLKRFRSERHGGGCNHFDGMPGFWCQWKAKMKTLAWDGSEKFYNYSAWLRFLLGYFFIPRGIKLNGTIKWVGEDNGDTGTLTVKDNVLSVNGKGEGDTYWSQSTADLVKQYPDYPIDECTKAKNIFHYTMWVALLSGTGYQTAVNKIYSDLKQANLEHYLGKFNYSMNEQESKQFLLDLQARTCA